jgi:hypothetical protein
MRSLAVSPPLAAIGENCSGAKSRVEYILIAQSIQNFGDGIVIGFGILSHLRFRTATHSQRTAIAITGRWVANTGLGMKRGECLLNFAVIALAIPAR